jgi:PKD repeat protein
LALLTFKAVGVGNATLHLTDTLLTDENFPPKPISHTTIDGTVNVAWPPPQVSVSPSNLTGPPNWICINDTFAVNVTIAMVHDLRYWQAGMSFNPAVLECVNYTESSFLKAGGDTTWQPGTINNDAGLITPYGATLNGANGVSGNGTLGFIAFRVKNTGASYLLLLDVLLLDSNYSRIEPETIQHGYFELPSEQPNPPTAYFTYSPLTAYITVTVTFDASGSIPNGGIITSYEWSFGDSFGAQGMIVNHTYTSVGDYNVTLTVTKEENLTNAFSRIVPVLALPLGPAIDVYTQRGGEGINQPSDTFAPGELLVVTAYLAYNLAPVADHLVTFSLDLPNGTMLFSRASQTDANGLALTAYLIPDRPVFGVYELSVTAVIGTESVSDFSSFRTSWLVEVIDVIPSDRHGFPKNDFDKGEPTYLTIYVQNNRLNPTYATVCSCAFDSLQQFLLFSSGNYLLYPNQTTIFMNIGPIPLQAYSGTAFVYVFAAQWLGGPAFSPEAQAPFWISSARPNVAVVGLAASPTNTYIGNSVQITVTVLNEYYLPQSFNVTIYCNYNALQTLAIVNLVPYVETNFTYIWDTYTFSQGDFIMNAYAWPVPGETDTTDNTYVDGTVRLTQRVSPVHDIAVTHVEQSKDVVGLDYSSSISITAQNQGDYVETFNITVYANQTIITEFVNVTLASGNSAANTFAWDTTGFAKGKYTIWAYAWPVPGETDTTDNNSMDGRITVTIPGDIDGDGTVDVFDAVLLAGAAGANPTSPNWNPNADINGDNIVDIFDAVILAAHAGESAR